MKSKENIDLKVTQDGLRFSGIYSLKIKDINNRKRMYASLVIINSLANFFIQQNLKVSNTKNIYKVAKLSEEFEMAKYILLEDYEYATSIIEFIYNSKITKDELVEWPLFMNYRNSEEYSAFVEKHKEDFEVSSFALQDKDSESETDSCIESQITNL